MRKSVPRASISILTATDPIAVRIVAVVVVSAVGAVGRGTNRCGPHRRRTVSATWIIPSPVTGISDPPYATGTNGSTSVNASGSDGAAVEASTASVPATPTARERVVRDKAGRN
jgi:hypothetical protein